MRPLDDAPGPDELLPDLLADTRARTDRAEVTDALDAIDGALTNNIRPLTGAAAMNEKKPTCGRCGVYRHLHPTDYGCEKPRLSFWWNRHSLARHVSAWAWIHTLPSRLRWAILRRVASERRDWCELVDSALYADRWEDEDHGYSKSFGYGRDYRGEYGCLCDFPMPWDAGPSRPGHCYCPTPAELSQS
jgi:hypothetical protein